MSTATIYARVPEQTKRAADAFAAERGTSLTTAVQELLSLGLEAAANAGSVRTLQHQVLMLEGELGSARTEVREMAVLRDQSQQELASVRQAAAVWAQRANIKVAACPSCKEAISGADLLVTGHCKRCNAPTSALMEPKDTDAVNGRDLMIVLGAVGVLLGLVVLAGTK